MRKNPKLSGTIHNVFGIQVGVSVNIFVRGGKHRTSPAAIYYYAVPTDWRRSDKYDFLASAKQIRGVQWKEIHPDQKYTWLTEGLRDEFERFLPIGNKESNGEASNVLFRNFGNGIKTNRDHWTWNFDRDQLAANIKATIDVYNEHLARWQKRQDKRLKLNDFVDNNPHKIGWSETLKKSIESGIALTFDKNQIRRAMYRPFTEQFLYFDKDLNERRYQMPVFFPTANTEKENRCLWIKVGSEVPFWALVVSRIPDMMPSGGTQCFPFYTYDTKGAERTENIPVLTLLQFQEHYRDKKITKWDIFHYIYAVLNHPEYRNYYAANLRRELPRIPMLGGGDSNVFRGYADIGRRLTDLHIHYEKAAEYQLQRMENPEEKLTWRVEKMRLSKDKTKIIYNDFLTLGGVPEGAFAYRLGNRSALEWVIDQYRVSTDPRSGITNDPNRDDEPDYIVKLIGKVITVSLETQKLIARLPQLRLNAVATRDLTPSAVLH